MQDETTPRLFSDAILDAVVTGNALVNATDVSAAKIQSGAPVSNANFHFDVDANGAINASDVSTVKLHSGEGLP